MTVEEKRERIRDYCIRRNIVECKICPLYHIAIEENIVCYSNPDDEIIERNYEILFPKESEEWLKADPGDPWEPEEQNVKEERKTTLRDLLDIAEGYSIVVSEKDFKNPILTITNLELYGSEEFGYVLLPEFLDREVYRIKAGEYKILVALKEVE